MLEQVDTYLVPYVTTNLVALILLFISIKRTNIGRILFGIIFLLASFFNTYTVIKNPQVYLAYADNALLDIYQQFIHGLFFRFTVPIVLAIAFGQLLVAIGLFEGKYLLKVATIGGILFLLAILPLGVGSAFPSTLIMAFTLWLIFRKRKVELS